MCWGDEELMGTPLCPHASGQPAASQEENRGFELCHEPESSQHSTAQLSLPLEGVDEVCQLVPWLGKVWTLRSGNPQESGGGLCWLQRVREQRPEFKHLLQQLLKSKVPSAQLSEHKGVSIVHTWK